MMLSFLLFQVVVEAVSYANQSTYVSISKDLSALYAAPKLLSLSAYGQPFQLAQQCLPELKYSTKRYQLTIKSGYDNTLKILWRDSGIPQTPSVQNPQISTSDKEELIISGFPQTGWAASTVQFASLVYTLSSVSVHAPSWFYVMPTANSPLWFQVQVDCYHTVVDGPQRGQELVMSSLWRVSDTQSSLFMDGIVRKLSELSVGGASKFAAGELNLKQFVDVELESFQGGFYQIMPRSQDCRLNWIVSNKVLPMGTLQFQALLGYISVNENMADATYVDDKSSAAIVTVNLFQLYLLLVCLF